MSLSNAQLDALDRELDENQRELIILPMDGPVTRIPPFTTVPSPTKAPQICTRTQPGLLDGAWGKTQAAYNGTVHKYVNTNAGVPSALAAYDVYNFAKFYRDIGGFGTKVKISTHNGRQYLVLTGYPGLRNKLKGTRYGLRNPQLVEMGIGKYGMRGTSISGFKLSCYVAVGIEVLEWVFDDEAVISDLFVGIGIEFIKAAIATLVGYLAALAFGMAAPFAVVFVAAGAAFVLITGYQLNVLDKDYKIKETVKAAARNKLHEIEDILGKFTKIAIYQFQALIENNLPKESPNDIISFHGDSKSYVTRKIQTNGYGFAGWPLPPRLPR